MLFNIMHQTPVQPYQDKYFQRIYTLANIVEAWSAGVGSDAVRFRNNLISKRTK